jgi:glycosyltransferase involved in cell wall biosynthesis
MADPRQEDPSLEVRAPVDICYVIASMIVGGTQTHLLQVFRFLDRARFRPHLFVLRDGGGLISAAEELGVTVSSFGMRGSLWHPGDLVGLMKMRRAMRKLSPAVVHTYLMRANFYGAVAARAAGVPSLVTSKRGHHDIAGMAERFGISVSNRLSDVITGNAPSVLEFTRRTEPSVAAPMEMIPSGIDTDRFDPVGCADLRDELGLGRRPVVGTAITWRPRKGFRMLFHAFDIVRRTHPDAALLIAGVEDWTSGDSDPKTVADELGITDSIYLLGRRSDMPQVLATFDVFTLPSESEGMSNAVLEAMAMAKPVVATAVGGNPVVIEEGRTGFLVEYADHEALAERLLRVLGDDGLRREAGVCGRERAVGSYSARSMVGQMEALYQRLGAA